MYYIQTNELYHHGILGMKWGIRRYQNKDGSLTKLGRERIGRIKKTSYSAEDITLKKGTKFNRIGTSVEKDIGRTYVTMTENDKWRYIDAIPSGLFSTGKEGETSLITLKAIEDLNIAGAQAQTESFFKNSFKFSNRRYLWRKRVI